MPRRGAPSGSSYLWGMGELMGGGGGAVLRRRRGILLTSLGLIFFAAYLAVSNPFKALLEVGRVDLRLFLLSILINDAGLVLFAVSWYLLLRGMDVRVSVSEAIQATFISLFVVWMIPIPIGSEIIRAYLIRHKENSDIGKAVASVVVHKSMYNISFGVLIAFAAAFVSTFHGVRIPVRGDLLWFVVLFAAGSSIIFSAVLDTRLLRGVYRRSPQWIRSRLTGRLGDPRLGLDGFETVIDEIGAAVAALRSRMGLNLAAFLMVAFQWSTGSITAWLVALSLGRRMNFWVIVVIYAVVEFIQQLNIVIPGGLGIVDAGLTGAFVLVGVPLSLASAISLLTRLVTYWLEVVLAGIVSIHYGYRESLKAYLNSS